MNEREVLFVYAVIETGGKQYKVTEGETVFVEKLAADEGAEVVFDKVLVTGEGADVKVGAPTVDGAKVTAKVVIDAAKAGDKTACEIFDNYIKYITVGLINIVNCFDPDVIAIGGGVAAAGDFLLDAIKKSYEEHIFYKDIDHAKICFAQMGNDAGIVGAAMLS